ncbi:T-cell immunoglobulin and mucin domain-containing protein 4 isoform X2 [Heterocephalus glaber]|uniref:T-cell immunoglobulin and mucin domain-containing protein 4 isoform X2 n=1 Tax=Heterocephalus glaber TaxID=10181 RepID=UPI00034F5D8E|nr:T-cell immunoglobulin and mucin domain-containing protein 4 isoform X2 [Heterocephalus glaber]
MTTRAPTTSCVSTAPPTPAHTQSPQTARTRRVSATPHASTSPVRPAHTQSYKTATTTRAPTLSHVSAAPPTPAHTQSYKTEPTPPVSSQAGETQPTTLQETKPQLTTSSPDSGPTAPARSEVALTAFLGQSVTLPCLYLSWSPSSHSMCWGKGQCPNSKCNQELIHTDGTGVTLRMSEKYRLRGKIQRGDVSLTILNTEEGDSGVYCCRIEVPGWFNDVKRNIQLVLRRAPTTMDQTSTSRQTTTTHLLPTTTVLPTTALATTASHPATTPHMPTTRAVLPTTGVTTTTSHRTTAPHVPTTAAVLPTTFETTRELTAGTPFQAKATSIFTTTATMCLLTRPSFVSERTPETSKEGPISTAGSEAWFHSSTSQVTRKMSKDTSMKKVPEPKLLTPMDTYLLMIIIASGVGLALLALLGVFLLRGKVMKANCLQKHKSPQDLGESQNALSDVQHEREDEDGLFTL